MTAVVAILGASGEIGREVALRVARRDGIRLRLGARRASALADAATESGLTAEIRTTDIWDDASLRAFCAGADVVVSCAGPTYRVQGRAALAALRAGADYVDVGGDDPAREQIESSGLAHAGRALLSAGTVPGLSALLPRWLVERTGTRTRMTAWAGGMERCSRTVAQDMLLSLSSGGPNGKAYGTALAAWRGGRAEPRAHAVREGVRLPGFPGEVVLQPFLSAEAERVARRTRLLDLDWWNVWPTGQVWSLLARLPAVLSDPSLPTDEVVERMREASAVDLVGRAPWYRLRMHGVGDGGEAGIALSGDSSAVLTATMAAQTVFHLLDEERGEPGARFAADVVDADRVLDALGDEPRVRVELDGVVDGAVEGAVEEGEL